MTNSTFANLPTHRPPLFQKMQMLRPLVTHLKYSIFSLECYVSKPFKPINNVIVCVCVCVSVCACLSHSITP